MGDESNKVDSRDGDDRQSLTDCSPSCDSSDSGGCSPRPNSSGSLKRGAAHLASISSHEMQSQLLKQRASFESNSHRFEIESMTAQHGAKKQHQQHQHQHQQLYHHRLGSAMPVHPTGLSLQDAAMVYATSGRCPPAGFPSLSMASNSSSLFMSPALFKPILTSVGGLNHGRPLNLSMSNSGGGNNVEPHSSTASNDHSPQMVSSASSAGRPGSGGASNGSVRHNGGGGGGLSSSGKHRPSPGLVCVVCGDTSSGKHYGILACNGCSGFFKRSVRRKLIYRCQAGTGNCVIDKQHRNQCQACRLKKCMQMGMNKDAVQNERQPRNTATIRPESLLNDRESERLLREGVAATVAAVFSSGNNPVARNQLSSSHCHALQSLRNQLPGSGDAGALGIGGVHHHQQQDDDAPGADCELGQAKKEVQERDHVVRHFEQYGTSGGYLTTSTGALSSTSFAYPPAADQAFAAAMIPCHQESVYETSARLLFMAVKWAKNLPSFASLTFRDQVILLEESWAELFLLCAIQWCLPLESAQLFTLTANESGTSGSVGERSRSDLRVLGDLFARFKSLAVDPAEFACLKALALFKPEARGLKDSSRIESMQDQAQLMLLQHVKGHSPTNPTRFGKLLLLLVALRFIPSEKIGDIYFHRTIGNTPMEKLLCDMFKC